MFTVNSNVWQYFMVVFNKAINIITLIKIFYYTYSTNAYWM